MRKRIIIGLLAIAVIGVVAVFVAQPKKGTLEWHKREYLSAWKILHEETWAERVKALYYRVTKTVRPTPIWGDREEQAEVKLRANQTALIRLGYFAQHRVALSNRSSMQLLNDFMKTPPGQRQLVQRGQWRWIDLQDEGTNALLLTGPRELIREFDAYVNKGDDPEGGK